MLRLTVPISGNAAAAVLDRLLPVAPFGVHETPGALVVHAASLPDRSEICRALGVQEVEVVTVDDEVAARLAEIARPEPVDGRVLVRAAWMAPLEGVEEVVLADATAFGTGEHPTTRDCLSMLLTLPPGGAFADLGCGAGVLAIVAARHGWEPVTAIDVSERAVAATRANAAANEAQVEVLAADLMTTPPPPAATAAANVPVDVHLALATAWDEPPEALIVSGVHADDRAAILAAYGARGLALAEERAADPWLTLLLRREEDRDGAHPPAAEPPAAPAPEPIEDVPAPEGERLVELGARAALFDLPNGGHFDVWALDDSLRWALRGPIGTTLEVEEETRLVGAEENGSGRPPTTVRLRLLVTTPAAAVRATLHLTVATAEPGLVRIAGSAEVTAAQS